MKFKNPFKKAGLMTTLTNVAVGGAANVAVDYAVANVSALSTLDPRYVQGGKIVLGALLGGMSKNQYVHAAADGIAVVGASELISGLVNGTTSAPAGLPRGTVGAARMGDRYFKKAAARKTGKGFTINGAFVGK